MLNQRSIQTAIQSSMQDKGWFLKSVCGLPPAFVRDARVTPYFHCSQIRRTAKGNYAIQGVIGIIDTEFEKLWANRSASDALTVGFGVILDILNVKELSEKRWIEAEADASVVDPFCSVMAEILEQMPKSEEELINALQEGRLYRFQLDQFAGFSYRKKFYAFKEFVTSLQRNSARSKNSI